MSFNEIADIVKIAGAAATVLGLVKVFASFCMESSISKEFDQLFKDKIKRKQINIFTYCQDIFLAAICIFIAPAFYFKFFIPNTIPNCSFILDPLYKTSFLLFFALFLILLPITVTLPFIKPNKNSLFCRITRYMTLVNMITFMFFYWRFFYINIDSNIMQTNKDALISIVIFIPLFMSFFYKYLNQQLRNKHKTQYLVETLSEEKITELQLIHNFIIDDKRSVFHEKSKEDDETFYVCDFSSKVYLKYSKVKARNTSSN